jgi:hypothetical protein
MELEKLTEIELITLRDSFLRLHLGISDKDISIYAHTAHTTDTNHSQDVQAFPLLKDQRLDDLIWTMCIEVHNELCNRFACKIIVSQ